MGKPAASVTAQRELDALPIPVSTKDMNVPEDPTIETIPEDATIAIWLGAAKPLKLILGADIVELNIFWPVKLKLFPLTIELTTVALEVAEISEDKFPDTALV
jgi:hypothetical protein